MQMSLLEMKYTLIVRKIMKFYTNGETRVNEPSLIPNHQLKIIYYLLHYSWVNAIYLCVFIKSCFIYRLFRSVKLIVWMLTEYKIYKCY